MSALTGLKAIETVYNGYRFRSRLEARWAVFFDALAVKYQYEPEGFDLGPAGRYLPDFWLPDQKCWVEIKAVSPSKDEQAKASALAAASGKNVFIFFNELIPPDIDTNWYVTDSAWMFDSSGGGDYHWLWCECPFCGCVGIEFDGRSDRLSCKGCMECYYADHAAECSQHGPDNRRGCDRVDGDKGYNPTSPRIVAAYAKARGARFEFGERGR